MRGGAYEVRKIIYLAMALNLNIIITNEILIEYTI